jgi:hypothetical protein
MQRYSAPISVSIRSMRWSCRQQEDFFVPACVVRTYPAATRGLSGMRLRAGLIVLMAVAYPLLAHLGALLHSAVLACGAVLILLTVLFSAGLWHGRIVAWLGWIALCAATIGLSLHGHARLRVAVRLHLAARARTVDRRHHPHR